MIYIGNISTVKVKNKEIRMHIPPYHRAATGMRSNTRFFSVPIINCKSGGKEIILSPIPPKDWKYIYRIEVIAEDRQGLIHDIAKILAGAHVNIYVHDFLTLKSDGQCQFTIVVDISISMRELNISEDENEIRQFIDEHIKVPLSKINELDLTNNSTKNVNNREVMVKCGPNLFLNGSFLSKDSDNRVPEIVKDPILHDSWKPQKVSNQQIVLDEELLGFLELEDKKEIQYILISDSEEKFSLIKILPEDQYLVSLDICHANSPGAIHAFSNFILESGYSPYNIVSAYSRLEDSQSCCHWHVIVDVSNNPKAIEDFSDKAKWIEHARRMNLHVEIFDIRMGFTKNLFMKCKSETVKVAKRNLRKRLKAAFVRYRKDLFYGLLIALLVGVIGVILNWFTIPNIVKVFASVIATVFTGLYLIYQVKIALEVAEYMNSLSKK